MAKTIYARPWGGGVPAGTAAMLGAVLVLVVLFFMLRRYAVRPSPGAARRYRPKPLGNAPGPEEQNSDEVDAELRRQVNAYRHQRRADVEPRDANDKDHSC